MDFPAWSYDAARMNWKLIAQLSLFGLAMGVATVFAIPSKVEPLFWLAIFATCATIIARRCTQKHFLHGLCVSLLNSVWITSAHVVFFSAYIARHAQEAAMMASAPMPGRAMMIVTGPVVGLVSGLVLGLFAFVASRFVKPAIA
jgi:hypothetical protein